MTYLYHMTRRKVLENILAIGIVPVLPDEWKRLLPPELQSVPVVWLTGNVRQKGFIHSSRCVIAIKAEHLDQRKLHKLDVEDVNWWVYEDVIPPEVLITGSIAKIRALEGAKA